MAAFPFRGNRVTTFRADIEGLRGVAVLLVMLAHASIPGFSGGFIGVDIFFVISGYLITGLLVEERDRAGRVDFRRFYARRIKRLAGALLAMVALVSVACILLLPDAMQAGQATAAFWAVLWSSNLHFAFLGVDYFDASSKANAFLHTWSLGVEEQFYLVWPLLILWACKGGHRWRVTLVAGVTILSLAGCWWLAWQRADQAYYLMPTRLWQLSVGALVWFMPVRMPWLRPVGILVIVLSVGAISDAVSYPWPWALLPALGAAAMVSAGPGGVAERFLSGTALRWLGRISYSLYLWHWPILVLGLFLVPDAGIATRIGMLGLAMMAGWASERWIERPLRMSGRQPNDVIRAGLLASAILAASLSLWRESLRTGLVLASGREDPLGAYLRDEITLPGVYARPGFDDYFQSDRLVPTLSYRPTGGVSRRVLLVGDSIGMQWEPAFKAGARERNWELVAVTKSACPMVDVPVVNSRIKRRYVECERWRERLLQYIEDYRPDMLVIGSAATYDFSLEQWRDGTRRVLERVAIPGREVIVMAPNPVLPFPAMSCMARSASIGSRGIEVDGCSVPLAKAQQAAIATTLGAAAAGLDDVRIVIMDDVICAESTCSAAYDGHVIYRDEHHLNARFVASIGPRMMARIESPDDPRVDHE